MRHQREGIGRSRYQWLGGVSLLAFTAPILLAAVAAAAEFNAGGVSGIFDTTITTGALFRVQERDPDLIGSDSPGGRGSGSNADNGNLNYDTGLASLLARVTHELKLDYENYGAFARATYFYDVINAQKTSDIGARTNRFPLSSGAVEAVGRDFELLDAYMYGNWDVSDHPVTARVGNHVLNWGESLFIPGGISAINPYDVAALRTPGAEIRDALLPVPMVSASAGITEGLSAEAFYQFAWEPTRLEPAGTLFSTNDFVTEGGSEITLTGRSAVFGPRIPRSPNEDARDQGQFGVALRYFAEELGGTEFGAYFINHHSRVPLVDAVTGSLSGLMGGNYAASARYRAAYPEDIHVIGASFNTNIAGMTVQGEYSLRQNQPLQLDDVDLIQAAFAPAAIVGGCSQAARGAGGATAAAQCRGTIAAFNANQILRNTGTSFSSDPATAIAQASKLFNQPIKGYRENDVSQAQMAITKILPPALGADQWVLIGEVGGTYVHGMPEPSVLRYDAPVPAADPFSWGYRLRARADLLNAIGDVALSPMVSWSHDVNGTTPTPISNFLEDRKAISVGLQASWLQSWVAEAQYTSYFGGGDFNAIHDRDFVSLTLKHFF